MTIKPLILSIILLIALLFTYYNFEIISQYFLRQTPKCEPNFIKEFELSKEIFVNPSKYCRDKCYHIHNVNSYNIEENVTDAGIWIICYCDTNDCNPSIENLSEVSSPETTKSPEIITIPETEVVSTPSKYPEINITQLEIMIHNEINDQRIRFGLSNLDWNNDISEVARSHSKEMAINNYFSHEDLQGLNVGGRLNEAGIYYWNKTAENIFRINIIKSTTIYKIGDVETGRSYEYYNQDSMVQEIVNGWMKSPGHRKNILENDLTEEGIGAVVDDEGNYYVTENFIRRTDCGFKNGPCCPSPPGYLPSCYIPYSCINWICK